METPKQEGIVPYLVCVIHELVQQEGTLWKKYTKIEKSDLNNILRELFTKDFKDTVGLLQNSFKTFEKDLPLKNLIKKGNDVKEKLTQTVKDKQKENYIRDYMSYLKNLPAVLVTQSSSKLRSGCCLQKISDINNENATYFKNAAKLKRLFATERVGFDKRPLLITSQIPKTDEEEETDDLIYNKPNPKVYEEWNISGAVPDITEIEKILDIVGKTAEFQKNYLKDFIFKNATTNDLLQLIVKLSQIQYLHIQEQYKEHNIEYEYLMGEFKFEDLAHNNVVNELQNTLYLRILQHHIVTQMCFPATPQNVRNNTLVLLEDGLDASLLKNFVNHSIDEIEEWVFNKTFNTSVNYSDYISKVREQEKNVKLSKINTMSPEDRKLYTDAKKLGIDELYSFVEQFGDLGDEEYEDENKNTGENDDEYDADSLNDS
jgi:hypothetical protein